MTVLASLVQLCLHARLQYTHPPGPSLHPGTHTSLLVARAEHCRGVHMARSDARAAWMDQGGTGRL